MSSAEDDPIEAETEDPKSEVADATDDDDDAPEPSPPPPSFSREEFLEWRCPRLGTTNPERMTNPVWTWIVQAGVNAWAANNQFDGPSALGAGPGWCFDRFGRSTTELPDGRIIQIAGEHEAYYDPDFFIYNDVVVRHPDGRIDIFGYPREVFPPTDFHSATLVGDRIILIGSVGYVGERKPGRTQVLALDLATFAVTPIATSGEPPGWISSHTATLTEDGRAIVVQRGKLELGEGQSTVENIDDWRLDLDTWQWQRLTDRRWPRREFRRSDDERNHLWDLQQACWYRRVGWADQLAQELEKLTQELGAPPDLDLAERLFRPSVAHEALADEDDSYDTTRITVDGVVVRFVRDGFSLQMTVEGDLPESTVDAIAEELREKLSTLEQTSYTLNKL
ncbi:hypothetical protein SAMN02745121_01104 [Nannocystis exedens]|uniref:Uncharacterized protein n=1 Tax=Nannocystis exedens TaxID=54 RepID=A0A1I1UIX5_9BACT|nr:hypothetical protein [Nannocystis exedens]PCC71559.1 hypothetical protein NAEX_04636 [Nannocystis exedens]SFD67890.1 hypothetical protein SAMN02745121_01104 [Nannocystis exedens]